jgi:D-arabinose 1-dehydrogenase-like Zn-dependent alcohol dehydrogenase
MPDGSPRRGWGAAPDPAARHSGSRNRWRRGGGGSWRGCLLGRRPNRHTVAGPHVRTLSVLSCGTRETCAHPRSSPAARSTADTLNTLSPTAAFACRWPAGYSDIELAPWLCAGLIGYRALRMAGEGRRLGIYGFGAAAHIVAQLCQYEQREVYAFTRAGDAPAQRFARDLGAVWAGPSEGPAPCELDAAILFAPVGALVPRALRDCRKGRDGSLRGHPHERHPAISVCPALG